MLGMGRKKRKIDEKREGREEYSIRYNMYI
jgi:hypothetical protein